MFRKELNQIYRLLDRNRKVCKRYELEVLRRRTVNHCLDALAIINKIKSNFTIVDSMKIFNQ